MRQYLTYVKEQLKNQKIETPSWGYADSGTRFNIYEQASSAHTLAQKLEDAAQVHKYTGICPTVAIHIPWDRTDNWKETCSRAMEFGLRIGAVNPNLFQESEYKLGSLCHPNVSVRQKAVEHIRKCISIAEEVDSTIISLWIPDGTNYPGQDSFRNRKTRLESALREAYETLPRNMRLLIEYKFFEPAFYHTDVFDWGTAYMLCTHLGDRAQVLVDLGHHPLGTNIEQIVALLLDEQKLGGFHFNNKKYADDDLVVGSINPYEIFLIYCELVDASMEKKTEGTAHQVAYMIDQSHNIKNKIEAMIQSVSNVQEMYAKALLVDRSALSKSRNEGRVLDAEECLKDAFYTDVRPLLRELREELGIDPNPLEAFRKSGYTKMKAAQRSETR
jgi:L-rhamnose isomerase/sugar isomerase